MFSILYVSDELIPFDERSLRELAVASAACNRRHGITGCLRWKNGRFVQYFEGEEAAVRSLMERIAVDARHRVVRTLELESIETRLFPHWDVGFLRPRDAGEVRVQDLVENITRSMRGPAFSDADVERMLVPMLRVISKSAEGVSSADALVAGERTGATSVEDNMTIVGIGASAGGLQPLQEFFRTVAADLDAAFVVIQHFSPNVETFMGTILQRETRMPVHVAGEGMLLEARSVYVIPPGKNLELMHGAFRLSAQKRETAGPQYPVDIFFRSMAKEYGAATIAIVLSGTGTDGSRGVSRVREAGGVVLTQSIESAEFDGMPASSIESGVVQQSLKPFQIAEHVERLVHEGLSPDAQLDEETRQAYVDRVVALMDTSEVDFAHYRVETLFRRVERRRVLLGIASFERYIEHFAESEEERRRLRDDLLITVTSFFRDPLAWEALAEEVIPPLVEPMEDGQTFRAWVAACATGEEAYTLAIVLTETLEQLGRDIDFKIYATDIERRALDQASSGRYGENAVARVHATRLERFFERTGEGYTIDRSLRENVIFAPHNFVQDAPFTKMHLVSCRNVLIYMQPELQQQALKMVHFSLNVDGALFLGMSETLGAMQNEFFPMRREFNLYKKLRDFRIPLHLSANKPLRTSALLSPAAGQGRERGSLDGANAVSLALLAEHVGKTLLLVDENRQTQLVIADPLAILEVRPGAPSSDVIDVMPPGIGPSLTIAIQSAAREDTLIRHGGLQCKPDVPASRTVDLEVRPQPRVEDGAPRRLLVLVGESAVPALDESPSDKGAGDEASRLREELDQTRRALQRAIHELDSSDEHQQAINERLTAANEELQSTNEELQSVNEELYTVNFEYQSKIHELSDLNHDLDNLLDSTNLGVIYLDTDLRIRRFTDASTRVVNLLATDIGRPFKDLSHGLGVDGLDDRLRHVLALGVSSAHRIPAADGVPGAQMGIHPYRTGSEITQGVLITFSDETTPGPGSRAPEPAEGGNSGLERPRSEEVAEEE